MISTKINNLFSEQKDDNLIDYEKKEIMKLINKPFPISKSVKKFVIDQLALLGTPRSISKLSTQVPLSEIKELKDFTIDELVDIATLMRDENLAFALVKDERLLFNNFDRVALHLLQLAIRSRRVAEYILQTPHLVNRIVSHKDFDADVIKLIKDEHQDKTIDELCFKLMMMAAERQAGMLMKKLLAKERNAGPTATKRQMASAQIREAGQFSSCYAKQLLGFVDTQGNLSPHENWELKIARPEIIKKTKHEGKYKLFHSLVCIPYNDYPLRELKKFPDGRQCIRIGRNQMLEVTHFGTEQASYKKIVFNKHWVISEYQMEKADRFIAHQYILNKSPTLDDIKEFGISEIRDIACSLPTPDLALSILQDKKYCDNLFAIHVLSAINLAELARSHVLVAKFILQTPSLYNLILNERNSKNLLEDIKHAHQNEEINSLCHSIQCIGTMKLY